MTMDKIIDINGLTRYHQKLTEIIDDHDGRITTLENKTTTNFLENVYPVGSIYLNISNISPDILFGFGEWEQIEDVFLLGAGTYIGGESGGESEVELQRNQIPNVAGQFTMHHAAISTNISAVDGCFTTDTINSNVYKNGGAELTGSQSIGRIIFDNGGEGLPHNNMPPYLTVYMWKRIK